MQIVLMNYTDFAIKQAANLTGCCQGYSYDFVSNNDVYTFFQRKETFVRGNETKGMLSRFFICLNHRKN